MCNQRVKIQMVYHISRNEYWWRILYFFAIIFDILVAFCCFAFREYGFCFTIILLMLFLGKPTCHSQAIIGIFAKHFEANEKLITDIINPAKNINKISIYSNSLIIYYKNYEQYVNLDNINMFFVNDRLILSGQEIPDGKISLRISRLKQNLLRAEFSREISKI